MAVVNAIKDKTIPINTVSNIVDLLSSWKEKKFYPNKDLLLSISSVEQISPLHFSQLVASFLCLSVCVCLCWRVALSF